MGGRGSKGKPRTRDQGGPRPGPRPGKAAENRIRQAFADLVPEPGGWVSLRRLREHLAGLPRAEVDAALLRLALQPGVHLEPEINQKTLTPADWDAGLPMGGETQHLLLIEPAGDTGPGSQGPAS
jgi:hypothetical protein